MNAHGVHVTVARHGFPKKRDCQHVCSAGLGLHTRVLRYPSIDLSIPGYSNIPRYRLVLKVLEYLINTGPRNTTEGRGPTAVTSGAPGEATSSACQRVSILSPDPVNLYSTPLHVLQYAHALCRFVSQFESMDTLEINCAASLRVHHRSPEARHRKQVINVNFQPSHSDVGHAAHDSEQTCLVCLLARWTSLTPKEPWPHVWLTVQLGAAAAAGILRPSLNLRFRIIGPREGPRAGVKKTWTR